METRKILMYVLGLILAVGLIAGAIFTLSSNSDNEDNNGIDGKPKVVTTNTIVNDVVSQVGGNKIDLNPLMKAGIDPHIYKPPAGDVTKMEDADIIFYSGLELEARMADTLVIMARDGKPTYSLGEGINKDQLIDPDDFEGKYDPHVWNDPLIWIQTVKVVEDGLVEIDPENEDYYRDNADAYRQKIQDAYDYGVKRINEIPEDRRVLITAHDAFGYFAIRYGFEVKSVQGTSTETEASPEDIRELSDFIVENQIRSIFIENITPGGTIDSVKRASEDKGWNVVIGGELYSDSLGEEGSEGDTYPKMHKANIDLIVDGLK
jgi:manganese/zinc/iron transport system substrate-binding protein